MGGETTKEAVPTAVDLKSGTRIVLPGLAMVVAQVRALLSFDTFGVDFRDSLWIISAVALTAAFVYQFVDWRKDAQRLSGKQPLWPLGFLAAVPLLVVTLLGLNAARGPSPFFTLKESARTGCQVPVDDWRSVSGRVGVIQRESGEVVYVFNFHRDHSDAVIENRNTQDPDYEWFESLVLDGRDRRTDLVLCFDDGSLNEATLRDIETGEPAGTITDLAELIALANGATDVG